MKNLIKRIAISMLALTSLNTTVFASDFSPWAENEYKMASISNLLTYDIVANNLQENITRKEYCELIMSLYEHLTNEEILTFPGSPFLDVLDSSISRAYAYGIVAGDENRNFNPDKPITREEAIKMIFNLLVAAEKDFEEENSYIYFKDLENVSIWARPCIDVILNENIIVGTDENLNPKKTLTREEAIAIVNRVQQKYDGTIRKELPITVGARINEENNQIEISWTETPNTDKYIVLLKDENGNLLQSIDCQNNWVNIENIFRNTSIISITIGIIGSDLNYYTMPIAIENVIETKADIKRRNVVETTEKYLGIPYVWGGTSPSGFDCSGLVQYVYAENGYNITRTTYTQWDFDGELIKNFSDLKVGDLLYFSGNPSPSHVGIYVGNGQMIHAPQTGDVVKYTDVVNSSYISRFIGAKRIIKD